MVGVSAGGEQSRESGLQAHNMCWRAQHPRPAILEGLEAALHTGKTEKVKIERKLTIEHLLPKEWERHWPLPKEDGGADAEKRAEYRNRVLHRVGNLTLLTKELNPAVSNGPWERKLEAILKHSALSLNRTLPKKWDENAIAARSEELFKHAVKIWPRPQSVKGSGLS